MFTRAYIPGATLTIGNDAVDPQHQAGGSIRYLEVEVVKVPSA